MRRDDIIAAVKALSSDITDVEVFESAGSASFRITIRPMDPSAEYNLKVDVLQVLEQVRPAGVGFNVEMGPQNKVKFYSTPEEVMRDFGGGDPPPAWPQRSRFNAIVEEMTVEIAPLRKRDPRLPEPLRAPRLFEQTIQVKERVISPCPNCNNTAFEPNADKTRVTCRGCPLPSPIFILEKDNWDLPTSKYNCSSCGRDSEVTMVMSEINLYCSGCGRLSLHKLREKSSSLRAAKMRVKDAFLKFNDKVIGVVDTAFIEEPVESTVDRIKAMEIETTESKWPTPGWVNQTLGVPIPMENVKLRVDLADAAPWPDELSDEALKDAVNLFKDNPPPNDWVQAIELMQQRVASAYGMTQEELTSSPAAGLFELFRVKLGLQPFDMFRAKTRDGHMARGEPERNWERRTGRTTKSLLWAIADFMCGDCNCLYVTGATEVYTRDLVKLAREMHERINLSKAMPVRPLMPVDVDLSYNYKREKSYVWIDHSLYERRGLR